MLSHSPLKESAIFSRLRPYAPIVFLAVCCGLVSGFPRWTGGGTPGLASKPFFFADEVQYAGLVQSRRDGLGDPYLYEYRTAKVPWPEVTDRLAGMAVDAAGGVERLVLLTDFVAPMVWFLLAFALLFSIGCSREQAAFLALIYTLEFSFYSNWAAVSTVGGRVLGLRDILMPGLWRPLSVSLGIVPTRFLHPLISRPFFLFTLLCVWRVCQKESWTWTLLGGLALSAGFYVRFFDWTTAYAIVVWWLLWALVSREYEKAVRLAGVLAISLLAGVHYFVNLLAWCRYRGGVDSLGPSFYSTMTNFWPSTWRSALVAIFVLATLYGGRRHPAARWLGWPIFLATLLFMNAASFLGLGAVQPGHWSFYHLEPLIVCLCAGICFQCVSRLGKAAIPALILLTVVHSAAIQVSWRQAHPDLAPQEGYLADLRTAMARLPLPASGERKVILGVEADWIRVLSDQYSFLALPGWSAANRPELLRRLLIAYRIYGYPESHVRTLFEFGMNAELEQLIWPTECSARPERPGCRLDPRLEPVWLSFYRSIPENVDEAVAWTRARYRLDQILLTPGLGTKTTFARFSRAQSFHLIGRSGRVSLWEVNRG